MKQTDFMNKCLIDNKRHRWTGGKICVECKTPKCSRCFICECLPVLSWVDQHKDLVYTKKEVLQFLNNWAFLNSSEYKNKEVVWRNGYMEAIKDVMFSLYPLKKKGGRT